MSANYNCTKHSWCRRKGAWHEPPAPKLHGGTQRKGIGVFPLAVSEILEPYHDRLWVRLECTHVKLVRQINGAPTQKRYRCQSCESMARISGKPVSSGGEGAK